MKRNSQYHILALLVALMLFILYNSVPALRSSAMVAAANSAVGNARASDPAPARTINAVSPIPGSNMPCIASSCPPPPAAWVTRAPLPVAVYGSGVASDGVYIYSAGGKNFLSGVTHQFVRFNPLSDSWSSLPPLPSAVEEPLAIYAEGKIFILGGLNSSGAAVALVQIYNISGGTWSTGAPMPETRQQMGGGYANGKIYVVGGYREIEFATVQNQTWEYTIGSNTWSTGKADLPVGLGGPGSGVVNGHLYILGGRNYPNNIDTTLNSVYDYDIAGNVWASRATIPTAVNLAGSAVYAGKIWLFGGGTPYLADGARAPNEAETVSLTQIFDPAANSWQAGPAQSVARSYQGGAVVRNQILSVGGYTGDASAVVEMALQSPLKILFVYADAGGPPTALQARLLLQTGVGAVNLFNGQSATPTLSTLAAYDLVVPLGNSIWANADALGDALADYQDAGGIVVGFNFDWESARFIGGRWSSGGYSPFNLATSTQSSDATLGSFATGHPLMVGVNTLAAFYREVIALAPGATLVASWSDGLPLLAFKGRAVGVNAYVGNFWGQWSGDYATLIVNAGYWLRSNSGPCTSLTCGPTRIGGQLNAADGTQPGRLALGGTASTCATPHACPAILNPAVQFHNDTYPFINNTPVSQCVTVTLDTSGCTTGNLFSAAYLGSFNPANLCTNYLADLGAISDISSSYSFTVPAWNAYTVVIHEINAGTLCPAYTLVVSGGACPAGPLKRNLLPIVTR